MLKYLFTNSYGKHYETSDAILSDSVGTFVINLDRAKARWNFVKQRIEQLNFVVNRISAVDGQLLHNEEIQKISDIEQYRRYFKMYPEVGTIGCSLSHEKALRSFLHSNCEFALICEDDIVFEPETLKKCISSAIEKKSLWDVLILEPYHQGSPAKIQRLYDEHFLCVYFTNVTHAGCYLINRETAKKFLQKFYPIFVPLDHYINAGWEFDIKFLGIEPRVVRQNFGTSQIKVSRSVKFHDWGTILNNAVYNIKRSIIHFLYNCCLYIKLKVALLKK